MTADNTTIPALVTSVGNLIGAISEICRHPIHYRWYIHHLACQRPGMTILAVERTTAVPRQLLREAASGEAMVEASDSNHGGVGRRLNRYLAACLMGMGRWWEGRKGFSLVNTNG